MGSTTAQSIVDRARTKFKDPAGLRFTDAIALDAINAGQDAIVVQRPTANTDAGKFTVATGSSRQTMAGMGITSGVMILDVVCNCAADGTRGMPVKKIDRTWLDDANPTWHLENGDYVKSWMADPNDPKSIYINPRPPAGSKLEIVHAAQPAKLTALTQAISIDDLFVTALDAWLMFSYYAIDSQDQQHAMKSQTWLQAFSVIVSQADGNRAALDALASAKAK